MKAALAAGALLVMNAAAADTDLAATAVNHLGLDLHRRLAKPGENLCVSPYSIQSALAMTFAGADGVTRDEMAKVLHFPKGDGIHTSLAALNRGLAAVEKGLTAATLADLAKMPPRPVNLHLPKFRIEPPTVELSEVFIALGMKTAFDQPAGSANFDRMAPRKPDSYLCISKVFHKTFLALDEKGTEAAAATAVVMMEATAAFERPQPVELKVDRPFLFAIQHAPSGACLFLGRVTDPVAK